jgi:hypothetical protein
MPAKKTFKNNPALNFISSPDRPAPPPSPRPARSKAAAPTPEAASAPSPGPLGGETKSQRVQLLMRPGLHRRLTEAARARGRSLNDLIHTVLDEWVERG